MLFCLLQPSYVVVFALSLYFVFYGILCPMRKNTSTWREVVWGGGSLQYFYSSRGVCVSPQRKTESLFGSYRIFQSPKRVADCAVPSMPHERKKKKKNHCPTWFRVPRVSLGARLACVAIRIHRTNVICLFFFSIVEHWLTRWKLRNPYLKSLDEQDGYL